MSIKKVATIGIDLGTTTSCVAGYVNGELTIIENRDGARITPSVVCFNKDGSHPIVGENGILAASTTAPENFVYEVKRMFGKGFHSKEVQKAIKFWPFKVQEIKTTKQTKDENITDNIGITVYVNGQPKTYEPIQVSAYVLNYLYESAKTRLNIFPTYVAITVPAYFNDGAKQRTLDAAHIAFSGKKNDNGEPLEVKVVLLAEPTAAAIAYGSIMMKSNQIPDGTEQRILVFDLGGGTYDVSVLDFSYDRENPVGIVKATDGDNFLGGSDFDSIIIQLAKDYVKNNVKKAISPSDELSEDERLKNELRLRQEAIKVKTSLSTVLTATFNLQCFKVSKTEIIDLVFPVTRVQFERAAKNTFDRLLEKIKGVLLSLEGVTPIYDDYGILNEAATEHSNPSAKSRGLKAIVAEARRTIDKVIMVGGSSRIPKVLAIIEDFFGETASTPAAVKKVISPLNPDEAVAYGAGYFANASCPDAEQIGGPKLLLIDQVPLNLNIETLGGVATPIITARTHIPCKQEQVFSTAADNQKSVEIVITQGNRPQSDQNHLIGRFTLNGIAEAPRGVPQIEVSFEVDNNNVLKVRALDKATGKEQSYVVENMSNQLSDADIERYKAEAEAHAAQDAVFTKKNTLRNGLENLIYSFQDSVEKAKFDQPQKEKIHAVITGVENWLNTEFANATVEDLERKTKEFQSEMEALIKGSGSCGPAQGGDVEEVN